MITLYVGGGGDNNRYVGGGDGDGDGDGDGEHIGERAGEDEDEDADEDADEDLLCICFWHSSRRCRCSRFFDENTFSHCL